MIIYFYFILVTLFLSTILSIVKNRYVKSLLTIIIIVFLSIIAGLKDSTVGTDTPAYISYFQSGQSYIQWLAQGIEPGFIVIIKVLQLFGVTNYSLFFLVFSIIFNTLVVKSIFKLSTNITISLLVVISFSNLFLLHFNILRQSLAIAFIMYSFIYLLRNDIKKYFFIVFMATMFHYSAIIAICFPLVLKALRLRPVLLYVSTTAVFIIYAILSKQVYSLVAVVIGAERYNDYNNFDIIESGGKIFFLNVFVFILFSTFFFLKKINIERERFFLFMFYCFVVLSFCISFMGLRYEGAGRIISYFSFSSVFLFSILYSYSTKIGKLIFIFFVPMALIGYTLFFIDQFNPHGIQPYSMNINS